MTEGGGGFGADPRGLHLLRAVRRPRPDVRQDDGHVRRERVRRRPDPGPLAGARPRLALRQGPGDPGSAKFYEDDRHLKLGKTEAVRRHRRPSRASTSARATSKPPSSPTSATTRTSRSPRPTSRSIRFHNRVVDTRCRRDAGQQRFIRAREIVVKHYQWVIRHDYLPRICEPSVVDDVFTNGRKVFEKNAAPTDVPTMPIEFSVAVFRLGHSMIRRDYAWNKEFPDDQGTLDFLFAFSGTSGFLGGGSRLPSNWIADWRRLYDLTETGRNDLKAPPGQFNRARRIDTLLADPLKILPSGSFGGDVRRRGDVPGEPRVPQPHAGQDGQARHRPEGGRPPQGQGRERLAARARPSCATATTAPASRGLTAAQQSNGPRRAPRCGSTSCARPSSTAAA